MRLAEIQSPPTAYYLASNDKLGQTASRQDLKILPDGRHHLTESLLEKIRPANCLPRDTSILLARSPEDLQALGHNAPRVYRAVPIGNLQWSDAQWVQLVRDAMELPVVDRPDLRGVGTGLLGRNAMPSGDTALGGTSPVGAGPPSRHLTGATKTRS